MIVRVRFIGKHYNSGLWPDARHNDTRVMAKPLFDQLLKDAPGQFVIVSVVKATDEDAPLPEEADHPAVVPTKTVVTKRGKGG